MKLYTEDQVRQAMQKAMIPSIYQMDLWGQLTPIKLPSDEDIEKLSKEEILYNYQKRVWWVEGSKFIVEQIKKQAE